MNSFIRDARIKFDYRRYEEEQVKVYRAEAERRFDTRQLQTEIAAIKHKASLNGEKRFGAEVTQLRQIITEIQWMNRPEFGGGSSS